jgi:hypothetical protein
MGSPNTFGLTLTNILLAALVVLAVLAVLLGTLCEIVSERKKRASYEAELDHDMREMFAGAYHSAILPRPAVVSSSPRLFDIACGTWRRLTGRR